MVYNEMVRPRVKTEVGVAIPPIRLTDDVQYFMNKRIQDKKNVHDKTKKRRHIQDNTKHK